ncbi:hypothetical protein A8L45_12070 [Veronia pacifica]|uniref:HTH araC/xylS-type domain-containing protein n=2 Tax=Veronia pacifica TaxID=1080227 RepID=A0A1C3EIG5_9GAMM|nr:hypothetical protein A8L45_12070 [Veronia pacifica]
MIDKLTQFPVTYLCFVDKQLKSMGLNIDSALRRYGLNPNELEKHDEEFTTETFFKLMDEAVHVAEHPQMGLLIGQQMRLNAHGALGFAALNCENFWQILELAEKFVSARTGHIYSMTHRERGEKVEIVIHVNTDIIDPMVRNSLLEAFVVALYNVMSETFTDSLPDISVHFDFPGVTNGIENSVFDCSVIYGSAYCGLMTTKASMEQKIKTSYPGSFREANKMCERELECFTDPHSLANKVEQKLENANLNDFGLNEMASVFNMSPRSFHRRLQDEGMTYKTIVESVRHQKATEMLRSEHLSIQEVAYNLGYSDPASFRRAFRRWENMSPMEYRESLQIKHRHYT